MEDTRVGLLVGLCLVAAVVWAVFGAAAHTPPTRAETAPKRELSFSWTLSHDLDAEGTRVCYRFRVRATTDGGWYSAELQGGQRTVAHQGRLTAAQYDAFVDGLDDCGLWDVESGHGRRSATLPTHTIRVDEGELEHTAIFSRRSTAYQYSLLSYVERTLPGRELRQMKRELAEHERGAVAAREHRRD